MTTPNDGAVSVNERVLITGGLGFIGSHLADGYLADGAAVTIVDSMVTAVVDGKAYDNHPRAAVVRASVEDYLERGGSLRGFDRVVHAASLVGPAGLLDHAGRVGAEIVRAAHDIIEACVASDVPLALLSSAEVYGRSGKLAEDDDIRVPARYNTRIEYAVAKTLAEAMLVNSVPRGLRAIIVRPFNVAGARQSSAGGFVVPTFVQQALAGADLTVFSTGDQTRAFVAIDDLARFVIEHMDKALASSDVVFNIGHPGNEISIRALAHRTRRLLASNSRVRMVDAKTVHGPLYEEAASTEKIPVLRAATDLGWAPRVGLDDLLRDTADYYRSRSNDAD